MGNLTKMLDRIIGEDVRLEWHCDSQAFLWADAGMMEQVILNLVVNSRDAMPQGGKLRITARKTTVIEAAIPPESDAHPGEFIRLNVSDTGTGIAPEHLSRIFEPFFTTKEFGKGTGLGLATVYGIVKQHQGWINVSSRVGAGTTFDIFLPAVQTPAVTATSPPAETRPRKGTEKILLVEDNDAVRLMTRRTLEGFGYKVVEATSGRKALEIWQGCKPEIDLLLTDIVMPDGINGRQLAELLREQEPALKVIFVSGYSLNAIGKDMDFLARGNSYFLQKPYHTNMLLDTIRLCLDKKSGLTA
jgi:CheY-like chemotaxis protein